MKTTESSHLDAVPNSWSESLTYTLSSTLAVSICAHVGSWDGPKRAHMWGDIAQSSSVGRAERGARITSENKRVEGSVVEPSTTLIY